jgi:hypothetical protein
MAALNPQIHVIAYVAEKRATDEIALERVKACRAFQHD